MPRSLEHILEHADALADRFARHDPDTAELRDAGALRALRQAALQRARSGSELAAAVSLARAEGHSWSVIGAMLGTSCEAARQRYGRPAQTR